MPATSLPLLARTLLQAATLAIIDTSTMKMRQHLILTALALAALPLSALAAQQAWITDDLRTGVQKGPSRNADFAGTIIAGKPVELLEKSKDGQYAHIRTDDVEGWVLARNVIDSPSLRARFDEQSQTLAQAQSELKQIRSNDQTANAQNAELKAALAKAQSAAQKAHDELLSLQRASENVVQIDALNRKLQDRVVALEQTNAELSQQNTRLSEDSQHRQMIIGGGLVLGGMIVFWLLSLMNGARRRRSTFSDF